VVDKAEWWEQHVVEVLTGAVPNAPASAIPRPEYDPLRCTLRQREISKIGELAADGRPVPLSTLQRMRRRYQSQHLMALRAARSAVKMGSPAVGRVGDRGLGLPVGRAVAQDRCWWPVDAGEL
jgi:putative transposase